MGLLGILARGIHPTNHIQTNAGLRESRPPSARRTLPEKPFKTFGMNTSAPTGTEPCANPVLENFGGVESHLATEETCGNVL